MLGNLEWGRMGFMMHTSGEYSCLCETEKESSRKNAAVILHCRSLSRYYVSVVNLGTKALGKCDNAKR